MTQRHPLTHTLLFLLLAGALILAACAPQSTATPDATEEPAADADDLARPRLGDFDPERVADIDLTAYPVMPVVTEHAREIFAAGREAGNNVRLFSKVGDCMTAAEAFLTPFGTGQYDLGEYGELQAVIDFFGGLPARDAEGFTADSFANPGLATASGFNAASVLDPSWANPEWCSADESPLDCEYRLTQPAIAIVMFGTNDTYYLEADRFDYHLRSVVVQTIEQGIIPVLNTFPARPEYPEKSILFNQIIIQVALDYDLPLINLWLALQDVPNQGVDVEETIHLTVPGDGQTGILDAEHLAAGYTFRNLITLQALAALQAGLGLTAG